eukprot:gene12535-6357_t
MSKVSLFKKKLLGVSENEQSETKVTTEDEKLEKILEKPVSLNFEEDEFISIEEVEEIQEDVKNRELENSEINEKHIPKKKSKKKSKKSSKFEESNKIIQKEPKVPISSILKMNSYGIFNRGKKSQKQTDYFSHLLNSENTKTKETQNSNEKLSKRDSLKDSNKENINTSQMMTKNQNSNKDKERKLKNDEKKLRANEISSTCLKIINNSFKLLETIKKEESIQEITQNKMKRCQSLCHFLKQNNSLKCFNDSNDEDKDFEYSQMDTQSSSQFEERNETKIYLSPRILF